MLLHAKINSKMTKVPNYPDIFYTGSPNDGPEKPMRRKANDILTWSLSGGQTLLLNGDEFQVPEVFTTSKISDVVTQQDDLNDLNDLSDEKVDREKSDLDTSKQNGVAANDENTITSLTVPAVQRMSPHLLRKPSKSTDCLDIIDESKINGVRNPSKSTDCLDIVDEPTINSGGGGPKVKFKTPLSKIKFYKATSDTHLNKLGLNINSANSLNNGESENQSGEKSVNSQSFMSQKRLHVPITDVEKERVHIEMLKCIRSDDCKSLKSMLKKRSTDVNSAFGKNGPLIHEAAYKGCTKCLKSILKAGSYVSLNDEYGWTALHAAVLGSNLDAMKILLENNALPNQMNNEGLSPCHLAVLTDDVNILHEIVKWGGDPLLNVGDLTPFQLAIDMKKGAALDYFLHMSRFLVDG